ncbi:hypothetical protein B0T17DRAFT_516875 [Bombardia bombarda]|uniref:Small ribosomal subunit protein bS18m n=1 Tax=Bombardia bombarda TaxID=252184 RepID=A0AA39XL53_9PEZI|nr:hypothetical protein B0T17DRAFT_516875 [Bombardia bombarda]
MSSRQWLSSAFRQCRTGLQSQLPQQQAKKFSSTPTDRQTGNNSNPAASLASLNDVSSTPKPSVANAALYNIIEESKDREQQLSSSLSGGNNNNSNINNYSNANGTQRGRGIIREGIKDLRDTTAKDNYMRQMPRRWQVGDVYAPKDLGPAEMKKWRKFNAGTKGDIIDTLGYNPLDNYRNFTLIAEYTTPFGRIKHSDETGLRPVNQRKMAKTIRRAIGLGIHPSVHRHPEILRKLSPNLPRANVARKVDPSKII